MSKEPSPQQMARAEKQKVATTEGAKAMAEVRAQDIAVRKNMERLRALRLAKEAEDRANGVGVETPKPTKTRSKLKEKVTPETLSSWLTTRRESGHKT